VVIVEHSPQAIFERRRRIRTRAIDRQFALQSAHRSQGICSMCQTVCAPLAKGAIAKIVFVSQSRDKCRTGVPPASHAGARW
jgi:hypothetical protein